MLKLNYFAKRRIELEMLIRVLWLPWAKLIQLGGSCWPRASSKCARLIRKGRIEIVYSREFRKKTLEEQFLRIDLRVRGTIISRMGWFRINITAMAEVTGKWLPTGETRSIERNRKCCPCFRWKHICNILRSISIIMVYCLSDWELSALENTLTTGWLVWSVGGLSTWVRGLRSVSILNNNLHRLLRNGSGIFWSLFICFSLVCWPPQDLTWPPPRSS